ncbi:MAG: hypothetical protein ACREPK_08425 [Rhodanobacteraceae bacterium]
MNADTAVVRRSLQAGPGQYPVRIADAGATVSEWRDRLGELRGGFDACCFAVAVAIGTVVRARNAGGCESCCCMDGRFGQKNRRFLNSVLGAAPQIYIAGGES